MGCGGSKNKVGFTGTGYHPRKLETKDVFWKPSATQWIVGNGSVLKFDVKSLTLSKVEVSLTLKKS